MNKSAVYLLRQKLTNIIFVSKGNDSLIISNQFKVSSN